MGIPKMFRFLTDRYPLIMQRLDEDHVFDHFYLDMNGIIHQCTHPSDSEIAITDHETMFASIFNYTERLYRIVAPTKLMFLAVDGVAPRAKMNQQRSRRFRSAKDAERTMSEAVARGDEIPSGTPFDSNCITPGTQFMFDLSERFRAWVHEKMSTDPAFQQGCNIVFSGPEVPGEGEHKIMDYIRQWKTSDSYSPATRHCMYGLDADLMMLGLVAHAPHFTLLREKMKFTRGSRKVPQMRGSKSDADEFQLLEIAMLRDMLFLEFKREGGEDPLERPSGRPPRMSKAVRQAIIDATSDATPSKSPAPSFKYDSGRIVDDFVFMCMLVGNDFIPNLPHLDIADGAINLMFRIYRHLLPTWGGYLTDRHRLHPDRLESFLQRIARSEPQYFETRAYTDGVQGYRTDRYRETYYRLKFGLDINAPGSEEGLLRLRTIYMEGLHWVLQYYHNGVSSWNWFYPHFYATLASDMVGLRGLKISFQRGSPFRPLTQLMAVLPPESAQFLPAPMQRLMTDPQSPVLKFYPSEFETDQNGKRNPWEAVVVVPFIDEQLLLTEVNKIDKDTELTDTERLRDELGKEDWFYAHDYPQATEKTPPVRPSKFFLPRRNRNSSSSTSSSPASSRSSSPDGPPRRRGRSSSSEGFRSRTNDERRRRYNSDSSSGESNSEISGTDSGTENRTERRGSGERSRQQNNNTREGGASPTSRQGFRRRGGSSSRGRGGTSGRGRSVRQGSAPREANTSGGEGES